jgi:hypothetical protein
MKIDLSETKTLWINLDTDRTKAESILNQFESVGVQNHERIAGTVNENRVLGCGISMHKAVSTALENLPSVVLEDDVKRTDSYKNIIEVPDETDAVYLGISHWGMSAGGEFSTLNGTARESYNEDFLRISGMCSLHAVLYISEEYTKAALNAIQKCNEKNKSLDYYGNVGHVDIGTALLQKDFLVLTPNNPFYYQDCPNNEVYTRNPLTGYFS